MKKSVYHVMTVALLLPLLLILAVPSPVMADTTTLAPNANGDLSDLALVKPAGWERWQAVATDDMMTSYVWTVGADWNTDLYQMGDTSLAGAINSVTVYFRAAALVTPDQAGARTAIKTHDSIYYGDLKTLTTSCTPYSQEYTANPYTGAAWTWAEVNALQAGVSMRRSHTSVTPGTQRASMTTQVWVVVDYSLNYYFAGWRPPVNLEGHEWKSGSTMPVKFLVEDAEGNPVTTGLAVTVKIGYSASVPAVLDDATIGQWKAEITLVGDGWQTVTLTGNITGVTPLEILVKP